jgi:hypothetical protein
MNKTSQQYDAIQKTCKDVFEKKMKDYGTAWRILRTSSLTDQIYIKANRIRSIEEKNEKRVDEGIKPEYIGIVNYSIMAIIQLENGHSSPDFIPEEKILTLYEQYFSQAKSLMEDKNHDYDEAWRNMRLSSLTDIILMKLMRIKQIEDNLGKTLISEGLDANYYDIINYAMFALIKIMESESQHEA